LRDEFSAIFRGGLAEQHKLPAYEATQSLYGISRSLLIVTNYLAEERVRRRDFAPKAFQLNIIASHSGSFETLFELITSPEAMAIYGALGLSVGGNFLADFVKTIFKRAVGQTAEESISQLEQDGILHSGDVDALVEAIEPAMRESHKSIRAVSERIESFGDSQID
jgi:hypothetical protein